MSFHVCKQNLLYKFFFLYENFMTFLCGGFSSCFNLLYKCTQHHLDGVPGFSFWDIPCVLEN